MDLIKEKKMDFANWRRVQYEIEKEYAQMILAAPKNSIERSQLFEECYDKVMNIIERYNPGGAGTHYIEATVSIVERLVQDDSHILDLGCGSGNLIKALIEKGHNAQGIDVSEVCIRSAKKKLEPLNAEDCIRQADISEFTSDTVFDCIVMDSVVEHMVPDTVEEVLAKCHSLLKTNGYIIILTPHKFAGPHDISALFLPLGAKSEGLHFEEYSFSDLERLLKRTGFPEVLGFPIHPRLFRGGSFFTKPSCWAAKKAKTFETWAQKKYFKKVISINRTFTRSIVAILFPCIAIGKKDGRET
jgi:2-polyprenyl-3-methyl-5-hydroxy-6-metoxy-1,4-benzoquinol methylase